MHNNLRPAHRPAYRAKASQRRSARLPADMRFWCRPSNPARLLNFLVGRILKFHESDPALQSGNDFPMVRTDSIPSLPDPPMVRTDSTRSLTDFPTPTPSLNCLSSPVAN